MKRSGFISRLSRPTRIALALAGPEVRQDIVEAVDAAQIRAVFIGLGAGLALGLALGASWFGWPA